MHDPPDPSRPEFVDQSARSKPVDETADFSGTTSPAPADPERVGPYRILETIGQGGMGIVYKAEQREPVRRIVALKVIKLGMDTKEVVARFDAERQALAMLGHPNVAKIFDGGMTENGRPYFAMEHVPGIALTDYCDQNRFTTRQRLELFIPVCHAIQHAHQKGIIHRDLKPSNILVQMFDGKPAPKVIDFGIAKATNTVLTQRTLFTRTGSMIGTPEYMSPEQAMTSGLDVDTRTDIYSLGVILYELLTGTLPFDAKTLREAGPEGMARIIRDSEPPRPSTRLTTLPGNAVTDTATRHRADARTLKREIRGDLDWITLKALEKDRTRRYETVNGLARDIERHLTDEPVQARPPSTGYRLSKFVRKHRGGVVAAGFVLAALLLGVVATSVALARAKAAEAKAKEQANRALAMSGFLEDMLNSARPGAAGGRASKVVDLLDRASAGMSEKLRGQPAVEIQARTTLAKTYVALGIYPQARQNYRRAYELARDTLGEEAETTLDRAADLAFVMAVLGDRSTSKALAEKTLATARRKLGQHHLVTYNAANSLDTALIKLGEQEEAIVVARQLVQDARMHPNLVPPEQFARYLNNLAVILTSNEPVAYDPQKAAEAHRSFREILELAAGGAKVPPERVVMAKMNLGMSLDEEGQPAAAEPYLRDGLAQARAELGDGHVILLALLNERAANLEALQRFEEAIPLRREQFDFYSAAQPADAEAVASSERIMAIDLVKVGGFDEAAPLAADAIALRQKSAGSYDSVSRGGWIAHETLKLSIGGPWTSQAVRAETCHVFNQMLRQHPTWPAPADHLLAERLRFKLMSWQGDAAGSEKSLAPVAEGTLDNLRKMVDPPPGVYLLWLEVPRDDRPPLHFADWVLFAPWDVAFHTIDASPEADAAAWEKTIAEKPVGKAMIQSLGIEQYWQVNADLPPRAAQFGTVATTQLDVPAGEYRWVASATTKARIVGPDGSIIAAWNPIAQGTVTVQPGAVEARIEHFFAWGNEISLWAHLVPTGSAADAALASVVDPKEGIDQALEKFGEAAPFPRTIEALNIRAPIYLAAGMFAEAAEDYHTLIELQPSDHSNWYYRGCLLAYLDDRATYRAHCRAMLARFGDTKDRAIADRTAKTCLLIDPAGGDLMRLADLTNRAVARGAPAGLLPWFEIAKGMSEYRSGHFDEAIGWLERSHQGLGAPSALATIDAFLAVSHYKRGDEEQARTLLDQAVRRAEAELPKAGIDALPKYDFENWLICHVALREAKGLIPGQPPAESPDP